VSSLTAYPLSEVAEPNFSTWLVLPGQNVILAVPLINDLLPVLHDGVK
jgi:hypothetical protein